MATSTALITVLTTTELCERILDFLPPADIIRCQRVCRRLREVTTNTTSPAIKGNLFRGPASAGYLNVFSRRQDNAEEVTFGSLHHITPRAGHHPNMFILHPVLHHKRLPQYTRNGELTLSVNARTLFNNIRSAGSRGHWAETSFSQPPLSGCIWGDDIVTSHDYGWSWRAEDGLPAFAATYGRDIGSIVIEREQYSFGPSIKSLFTAIAEWRMERPGRSRGNVPLSLTV